MQWVATILYQEMIDKNLIILSVISSLSITICIGLSIVYNYELYRVMYLTFLIIISIMGIVRESRNLLSIPYILTSISLYNDIFVYDFRFLPFASFYLSSNTRTTVVSSGLDFGLIKIGLDSIGDYWSVYINITNIVVAAAFLLYRRTGHIMEHRGGQQ